MDTRYDICPECGKQKRKVAKTCKHCQSLEHNLAFGTEIDFDALTPEWLAEFRGLFWGEGSAMIVPNNRSFYAILSLGLRDDDYPILEELQRKLGGHLLRRQSHNPRHGSALMWRVTVIDQVITICELLLKYPAFNAKKQSDVRHVLDFCFWRKSLQRFLTEEQRQEAKDRMLALRTSREYHP